MKPDPNEHLTRYRDFRPSQFDTKGLGLEDRQDWFVAPVSRTRDSGVLANSNWDVCLRELKKVQDKQREALAVVLELLDTRKGTFVDQAKLLLGLMSDQEDDYEVHRFGHWGPGWFEIILVRPGSKCAELCAEFACALSDYPILDDSHHSETEMEEANRIWKDNFNNEQRIEYIRKHRSQFEFHSFADMLGCVRGNYFGGYASELIEDNGY